jgi:hypothetical protein
MARIFSGIFACVLLSFAQVPVLGLRLKTHVETLPSFEMYIRLIDPYTGGLKSKEDVKKMLIDSLRKSLHRNRIDSDFNLHLRICYEKHGRSYLTVTDRVSVSDLRSDLVHTYEYKLNIVANGFLSSAVNRLIEMDPYHDIFRLQCVPSISQGTKWWYSPNWESSDLVQQYDVYGLLELKWRHAKLVKDGESDRLMAIQAEINRIKRSNGEFIVDSRGTF